MSLAGPPCSACIFKIRAGLRQSQGAVAEALMV